MSITTTHVDCSEGCGGTYRWSDTGAYAVCTTCGHVVDVHADIRPHLDANERTGSRHNGTSTPDLVIIRTDACECCGTISAAHFDVRVGDDIPARFQHCPNDPRDDDDRENLAMARRAGLDKY